METGNSVRAGPMRGLVSQIGKVSNEQQTDANHSEHGFKRAVEDVTHGNQHDQETKRAKPQPQQLAMRSIPVPECVNADR